MRRICFTIKNSFYSIFLQPSRLIIFDNTNPYRGETRSRPFWIQVILRKSQLNAIFASALAEFFVTVGTWVFQNRHSVANNNCNAKHIYCVFPIILFLKNDSQLNLGCFHRSASAFTNFFSYIFIFFFTKESSQSHFSNIGWIRLVLSVSFPAQCSLQCTWCRLFRCWHQRIFPEIGLFEDSVCVEKSSHCWSRHRGK